MRRRVKAVDRAARDRAVGVIEAWLHDPESVHLWSVFPKSKSDPALSLMAHLPERMTEEYTEADEREMFVRYVLLLRSNIPSPKTRDLSDLRAWPFRSLEELADVWKDKEGVSLAGSPLQRWRYLRGEAATLLERYLTGEIDRNNVLEQWPNSPWEPVLK